MSYLLLEPDVCFLLDHLDRWTIGVIVSAMTYGGLLSLTLSYIPLLLKISSDISRRMRNFLLLYVTIMVTISTIYIITTIVALMGSLFGRFNSHCGAPGVLTWLQSELIGALCTALASWGADWFMLWRCAMLYEGVSRPRRIALVALLAFMAFISLGNCAIFLVSIFVQEKFILFLLIASVTVVLNLVTATLITLRILYFDRYIRKTVGLERNSPYRTIVSTCVESSALIVLVSLTYVILYLTRHWSASLIPMQTLVHIYVISPLLIVYRVAQGKAATIRQRPSESGPVISVLCFAPQRPESPSSNNTV